MTVKYNFFSKDVPNSSHIYHSHQYAKYNRELIAKYFGKSIDNICFAKQVHSNKCAVVSQAFAIGEEQEVDCLITKTPNLILAIATADCVPILLHDEETKIIAVIHAGSKGAKSNIIDNAVKLIYELGGKNLQAYIGPAIRQESYQVTTEFYDDFLQENTNNANFFLPDTKIYDEKKTYKFDLCAYIVNKLLHAGIRNIIDLEHDTCGANSKYFSYRQGNLSGKLVRERNISAIMLLE